MSKQEEKAVLTAVESKVQTLNDGDKATLIIKTGEADPVFYPEPLNLKGTIDTVRRYLEQRYHLINPKSANIVVDANALTISLSVEEEDHFAKKLFGSIQLAPQIKDMFVNDGLYRGTVELSNHFKMKRSLFESKSENMSLVTSLKNFTAKVNKEVEKIDDRLHKRNLVDQVITSNLPESFRLNMPLFRGGAKVSFECEFHIEPDSLKATIISPEAEELIYEHGQILIAEEIAEIESNFSDILITYK